MSPRRANPELADRRRDALVRAGYAEVLDKGIQATTLDSVVARCPADAALLESAEDAGDAHTIGLIGSINKHC